MAGRKRENNGYGKTDAEREKEKCERNLTVQVNLDMIKQWVGIAYVLKYNTQAYIHNNKMLMRHKI